MFNLVLAALAGVVTIAAPCTLPVLPILLGASVGQTNRLRPAFIAAGFVIAFSIAALALSALTRVFDFDPSVLRDAAAVLLAIFGLLMIWQGAELIERNYDLEATAMPISVAWIYAPMVLVGVYVVFQALVECRDALAGRRFVSPVASEVIE